MTRCQLITLIGVKENNDGITSESFCLNVDLGYFYGANFSRSMAPNEDILYFFLNDGNHIWVPKLVEIFYTITPLTKVNVQTHEPQGYDEKLDF
jgi:hypothetical protein